MSKLIKNEFFGILAKTYVVMKAVESIKEPDEEDRKLYKSTLKIRQYIFRVMKGVRK